MKNIKKLIFIVPTDLEPIEAVEDVSTDTEATTVGHQEPLGDIRPVHLPLAHHQVQNSIGPRRLSRIGRSSVWLSDLHINNCSGVCVCT